MLRFLRRQIGYRIKKRTFVVLAITIAVTFLVASLLALAAVWLSGPTDVLQIEIREPKNRDQILGAGLDLALLPDSNLLSDPSFEPITFRETLAVYEGDAQTLTVSEYDIPEVINQNGFFNGADVRVLSPGDDSLTLKKTDKVASYSINRIGRFRTLALPADVPEGRQINDFAHLGDLTIAVGEGGLVLRDLALASPAAVISGTAHDLMGVCTTNEGFAAVSTGGEILFSADGATWTPWKIENATPLYDIAALDDDLLVAVGQHGTILAGSPGHLLPVLSPTQADLVEIEANDHVLLARAADGTVLRSTTGLFWDIVQLPGGLQDRWQAMDERDGTFVLGSQNGRIAYTRDGLVMTSSESPIEGSVQDILLLSDTQLIVLNTEGSFLYSNDRGQKWADSKLETGFSSQLLALLGDRQIISADAQGHLGLAPLVIEVELLNPLVEGSFMAGDLLYLEKSFTDLPVQTSKGSQAWTVYGPGQASRTRSSVPDESGHASMHLSMDDNALETDHLILSQSIDPQQFDRKSGSSIYQVELWMRQDNIKDGAVKIWLSGDFESIGTTIDHVGSTWKRYTHTFVLPTSQLSTSSTVRFNISYQNKGDLWLDRIHFGRADQEAFSLDAEISESLTQVQPSILRFNSLALGTSSLAAEQWAQAPGNEAPVFLAGEFRYPESQNIGNALTLAHSAQSEPWLVLDSSLGEAELLHLLEYLAGPVSSPYGLKRMNQGQILPWTDQFDHVYLEIRDAEGTFNADYLRSDYVDLMIRSAGQSPYYNTLKSKLIFVDGMRYSDGVWRSTADYHVSSLTGNYISAGQDGIAAAILAYYDRLPRNPNQARQGINELISPLDLLAEGQEQPQLADLITINLQELGASAALCNLAWPGTTHPTAESQALRLVAATLTRETAGSVALDTLRAESDLQAFAYRRNNETVMILANTGSLPLSARLSGLIDTKNQYLRSYDANGQLLRERQIHRSREQLTVLPGGAVILTNTP